MKRKSEEDRERQMMEMKWEIDASDRTQAIVIYYL